MDGKEITNLFLYGTLTKPTDLTDEALIREASQTTSVLLDAYSFMETGPGRFANGSQAAVVSRFMDGVGVPASLILASLTNLYGLFYVCQQNQEYR